MLRRVNLRQAEEALKTIKNQLKKYGPMRSNELKKIIFSGGGKVLFSEKTFYNVLRKESGSPLGEFHKITLGKKAIYYLPYQGSQLIEYVVNELVKNEVITRAELNALQEHTKKMRGLFSNWASQMPLVTLECHYPCGGLWIDNQPVKSYGIGLLGRKSGPERLPIEMNNESEIPFGHIFEHDEIGSDLKKEWLELKKELIDFEKLKGEFYLKIESKVVSRLEKSFPGFLVNSPTIDAIYNALVNPRHFPDYSELKRWKLAREGAFLRIDRSNGFPDEGWVSIDRGMEISSEMESRINDELHALIDKLCDGRYRELVDDIHKEYQRLDAKVRSFRKGVLVVSRRELFSACSYTQIKSFR